MKVCYLPKINWYYNEIQNAGKNVYIFYMSMGL